MSGFGADRTEAETFLAANPDIAFVETLFTPLSGVARGKRLMGGVVARGTARGEFRELPPETAARMLSALTMMHSLWCARRQFFPTLAGTSDDAICVEVLDFYLHALRPDHLVATGGASTHANP